MRILKKAAQPLWKLPEGSAVPAQVPTTITLEPPACRPQTRGFQFHLEPASVAHEPIATDLVQQIPAVVHKLSYQCKSNAGEDL